MNFAFRVFFLGLLVSVTCGDAVSGEIVKFGVGENNFAMEFVIVGNPGNAQDVGGSPDPAGAVSYSYYMAKYEVSQDMVDKVNASTVVDGLPLELITLANTSEQPTLDFYGIRDPQQPAVGVSWIVAARFTNWLNVSSGYPPAYKFELQPGDIGYEDYWLQDAVMWPLGDPSYDRFKPYRNRFARFVLPSHNEWYKAAYHDATSGTDGVYFTYPTGSDEAPTPVAEGSEPGTAVYVQEISQGPAVVSQAGGASPYGTIGQGGNAYEHQESFPRFMDRSSWSRGGSWTHDLLTLSDDSRFGTRPSSQDARLGFRVAMLNPLGDFGESGVVTAVDIDLLSEAMSDEDAASIFDLDQNDVVDLADHQFWVKEIAGSHFGDADLNGSVDFTDFLQLSANFNQPAGWAGGDFDGNGMADFADFLLLSDNFGKSSGVLATVPEPSGMQLAAMCAGVGWLSLCRRRF